MSFFLQRVRDRAEAEDLTQQVFVRLFATQAPERIADPAAFVFRIAANLVHDRSRSRVRPGEVVVLEDYLAELAEEELTPERVLLGKESAADVLRALDELGERTRDMFILFRLEGLRQREIARLFGCSQSTVEKHIMRATVHLLMKFGR